jgi:hypothetical protein
MLLLHWQQQHRYIAEACAVTTAAVFELRLSVLAYDVSRGLR